MEFKDKQEDDGWKNQCGIYGYIDTEINEVVYIGQTTVSFKERDKQHRMGNPETLCERKIQKYPQKYKMIPIESFKSRSVTNEFLNPIEEENIKKFNTFRDENPYGLNLTSGGDAFIRSDTYKKNISLGQNTTGYRWVSKVKSDRYSQGYYFEYCYSKDGKRERISSGNVQKLEIKVKQKNLPWEKLPGEYESIPIYKKKNKHSENEVFFYSESYTIYKRKSYTCKRGFIFSYTYYNKNKQRKTIDSVDLGELEKKIKAKNLPWEKPARYEEIKKYTPCGKNTTGYYHVSKTKEKRTKQGFTFVYTYKQNGKKKTISSVDIKKLEKEVKKRGLVWKKI